MKTFRQTSEIKRYETWSDLNGHGFVFGRIGAGKSVSTLSIIQGYHDNRGYKIWDLFGGERKEQLYWAFPSQEAEYWDKLEALGTFDEPAPKQYKVNFLYPYFESTLPKKLPQKLPFVNSKLFTIPLKDVAIEDVRMIIGNPSEQGKFYWEEVLDKVKKKDNVGALPYWSKKLKCESTIIYKNFIHAMIKEKFLMDDNCVFNLDFKEEAKNKEVISVLCLDFVPEKYHLFILNYFCKKLTSLLDLNLIPRRNIIFIRESATFFRATDDSVLEDKYKIFRTKMAHYIRMGRRGTYFFLDCQSHEEVRGLVEGSQDLFLIFKTTSFRDKESMCEGLKRDKRMRPDQVADLSFLEKGQAYIAEDGARMVRKVQIVLPRSDFWKKEYGNFYKNVWEQRGGKWLGVADIKEEINRRFKECEDFYKDLAEKEAPKKKEKKEEVEETQEEQAIANLVTIKPRPRIMLPI